MKELHAYPSTGHIYYTLTPEDLFGSQTETKGMDANRKREADIKKFREFVERRLKSESMPWTAWSRANQWLRYKFDLPSEGRFKGQPLLQVVVETSMETPSDGVVLGYAEQGAQEVTPHDTIREYFAAPEEGAMDDYLEPGLTFPLDEIPEVGLATDAVVRFYRPLGYDVIDVDLAVDLGNSRTSVVLLENRSPEANRKFSDRVRPLQFVPSGWEFGCDQELTGQIGDFSSAIVPSNILVSRPVFSNFEPHQPDAVTFVQETDGAGARDDGELLKRSIPRSFVELSPALIGGGSHPEGVDRRLEKTDPIACKGLYTTNSPKLYATSDVLPVGSQKDVFWTQAKNDWDADYQHGLPVDLLRGQISYVMSPDGALRDSEAKPTQQHDLVSLEMPTYPRASAVTFFGLKVLETAYGQINTPRYLATSTGHGEKALPRRLRYVYVTFPTSWTQELRSKYLDQWQRAIDIFALRFPMRDRKPISEQGRKPELIREALSESLCSQFPIVSSDVRRLNNDVEKWIQHRGDGTAAVCFGIEFGGGQTDYHVTEYRWEERQHKQILLPHSKFTGGTHIAGNVLDKKLIETVLIPTWFASGVMGADAAARRRVTSFFLSPASYEAAIPNVAARLDRLNRQLFQRLAHSIQEQAAHAGTKSRLIRIPLSSDGLVSRQLLRELNDLARTILQAANDDLDEDAEVFPSEQDLFVQREHVDACIAEVYEKIIAFMARIAGHYKCHFVTSTGKPSEQPKIMELIERYFPVPLDSIIHAKGYPVSNIFPILNLKDHIRGGTLVRRISDPKMCTSLGAAKYLDNLKNPDLNQDEFRIEELNERLGKDYFWGVFRRSASYERFFEPMPQVPELDVQRNKESGLLLFGPEDYRHLDDEAEEVSCEKRFRLEINRTRIARQIVKVDLAPDNHYELRLVPQKGCLKINKEPVWADVTLRWISRRGDGERLELVPGSVELLDPEFDLQNNEVRLILSTLPEGFWLDDPSFELDFTHLENSPVDN